MGQLAFLVGSVAQIVWRSSFPFPQTELSYGLCDGYAKSCVAVEHCDPDLELGDLSVEVSGHMRRWLKSLTQCIFVSARLRR